MAGEADLEMLQKHVEQLGEHFDSVQIFCTRHEPPDGTVNVSYGSGNWFARFGHVSDWLTKSSERTKEYVRREEDD